MTVPVLAGPTASGKTDLALELAEHVDLEIVSADAMLVYEGMDIGTAKPTPEERARVPHHLIDVVRPDEAFSVAEYVAEAESAIAAVQERGKVPLVVGGTGFYIRALSEGLPTVPEADEGVQAPLWARFEEEGLEPLEQELARLSPPDAARAQRNPRRIIRALEIIQRTGKTPSEFERTRPRFSYSKVVLMPPPEVLTERVAARTERMFERGLVEEVELLLARYPHQPTAMQAIGYKEVVAYLQGQSTLEEAKAAVTLATVQYAKRQRTWFRKEPGAVLVADAGTAYQALMKKLEEE